MCEPFAGCDSVAPEKSEFRPSLKYLLTGWRLRRTHSTFPFNDSHERKLCKMIFESWKHRNYTTREQLQLAAFSLAKANNLRVHPSWEKLGRASETWLKSFLRNHPEMRDLLIGKQGVPPKRKSEHSEGDLQSDSSSDFGFSDGRYSDSEADEEESRAASPPRLVIREGLGSSVISSDSKAESDDEQILR